MGTSRALAASLRQRTDSSDGSCLVVRAAERCMTLKEEEKKDSLMLRTLVNPDVRPTKAEPEPAVQNATTDSAKTGTEAGDISWW